VASTAVSSPNAAVVDCVEVERSAVDSKYKSVPRTLPCGTLPLTEELPQVQLEFSSR
jgi:hypothetical protein